MEADWYVDPLGRFHGRYFDGESWTDQVSDDGVSAIDPDWPPTPSGDGVLDGGPLPVDLDAFVPVRTPAVVSLVTSGPRRASMLEESPVRVVAVLEERTVVVPKPPEAPQAPEVPLPADQKRRSWWLAIVGAAALALLAVVIWLVLRDAGQGQAAVFDPSDRLEVGSSSLLNGASTLQDLARWHADFARERGVSLDENSSCWYAELAETMVAAAHCGPVGSSEDGADLRFDSVPLRVEDTPSGQIVEPLLEDVAIDEVLAHGLELIGAPDLPAPPDRSKSRGDRDTGD